MTLNDVVSFIRTATLTVEERNAVIEAIKYNQKKSVRIAKANLDEGQTAFLRHNGEEYKVRVDEIRTKNVMVTVLEVIKGWKFRAGEPIKASANLLTNK